MITRKCETCEAEVTRKKASDFRQHVYCTKQCYWKSDLRKELNRRPENLVTCDNCGKDFHRAASQAKNRISQTCSQACRNEYRLTKAPEQLNSQGYVKIYVGHGVPGATKTGHIMQHRKVMQDKLGRELFPGENVHHKNGDRQDNRLENLELWVTSQPSGQRPEDLLAWADMIIERYRKKE